MQSIEMMKVSGDAVTPTRAHPEDAGLDLYALEDVMIESGQGKTARTGVAFALPEGHVGMIADRSSLAKKGIKTAGGIIDAGYRGEILIVLWNLSSQAVLLKRGERIAQMLILPIVTPAVQEVTQLTDTKRGVGGFGSTGR